MRRPIEFVRQAIRIWWESLVHLTFFNMLWVIAQFLILTGPPATAAMYVIASQYMERDLTAPKDFFVELKRLFLPAWKWGALNLIVLGLLLVNFVGSMGQEGELWYCLRVIWIVIAMLWYVLNLFYWPLWLSQEDRRLINTYRNSFVMLLRMPRATLTLSLISVLLIVFSLVTLFPLALALMVWLALIGMQTVRWAIEEIMAQQE